MSKILVYIRSEFRIRVSIVRTKCDHKIFWFLSPEVESSIERFLFWLIGSGGSFSYFVQYFSFLLVYFNPHASRSRNLAITGGEIGSAKFREKIIARCGGKVGRCHFVADTRTSRQYIESSYRARCARWSFQQNICVHRYDQCVLG